MNRRSVFDRGGRMVALFAACIMASAGCTAYRWGAASLYPPDIHTVYVPVFESDSFRRDLGERLTEAVIKEIELKTPMKVVGTPQADSVLSGRILEDVKHVVVENRFDQPREVEVNLRVAVRWTDRRGALLGQQDELSVPADLIELSQSGKLVGEFGQSGVTAQQEAIVRLARQIVALMEIPW